MSADSFTDHRISCNWPECTAERWGSQTGLRDRFTAADVRKVLKKRGWLVSVRQDPALGIPMPGDKRKRLDFCPVHKARISDDENASHPG